MTRTEELIGPRREEFLALVQRAESVMEIQKGMGVSHHAVVRAARTLKVILPDGSWKAAKAVIDFHANHAIFSNLSQAERADYDSLKKAGYSRAEALKAIDRADLVKPAEAAA